MYVDLEKKSGTKSPSPTPKPINKFLISLFIIFILWTQIAYNFQRTPILPEISYQSGYHPIVNTIIYGYNMVGWNLRRLGWLAGQTNYWRMFAPVDRFNWHMIFVAVHPDGSETLLPLSTQSERNFWQRNLIDFRDGKFHVNIYSHPEYRQLYADYLCRTYTQSENPISSIRIDLQWQPIFSPEEAKIAGAFWGMSYLNQSGMGDFPCLGS
ncbi:MAG: hypothetical protein NW237_04420 [Cyanobacteriota bacterium]|nr:hypothetical protein [Cyanobacteriota bacterium]